MTLHVTNGDSAAGTLRATSVGGDVLAWQDVLHEGPLADVPDDDLRLLRARFLASHGWGDTESIAGGLRERDETLDAAVREGRPVVLWFEHDLYDQLQLLQVLARLPDAPHGPVELVQSETYLGSLDVADLERLWPTRVPVDATAFSARRPLWDFDAIGQWTELTESGDHTSWVRTAWDVFAPHLGDGCGYINHLSGDEHPEQVRASYGSNLARLRQLKTSYDPANTFRMNPNITPQ